MLDKNRCNFHQINTGYTRKCPLNDLNENGMQPKEGGTMSLVRIRTVQYHRSYVAFIPS
jgi:hypothetical protein